MAITLRANGTSISGTANITVTIPAGVVAGDLMICSYGTKPYGDAPTIDQGWTLLGSATDGTVAAGVDSGSMKSVIWYKIHTGTESNPTITNTTNSVSCGKIDVYQCTSGAWNTPVGVGGGDTTSGTSFSATLTADPTLKTNDALHIVGAINSDSATSVGSLLLGKVGGTGSATSSNLFTPTNLSTASGQDMNLYVGAVIFSDYTWTGYSSLNINGTLNAAGYGSVYCARLRENSPPTTVLNSPTNGATSQSNLPTLNFTGTDSDSNTIEYNIEIYNTTPPLYAGNSADLIYGLGLNSNLTSINLLSPFEFSGIVDTVEFKLSNVTTGIKIGSFYGTYPNLQVRNFITIGDISSFATKTVITGLSLSVNAGDYIGIYYATGNLSRETNPNLDFCTVSGDKFGGGINTYSSVANRIMLNAYNSVTPIVNADSSIPDAGFTAGHPFTSGVQKSYTVQTTLDGSTVYYWRVRGIDPTGSNYYGAWSSTYSFTTAVGSPTYNESVSLSSINSISTLFNGILGASITLSSDGTIVNTSIADLLAVANVTSDNQMTAINNLISEVSASIGLNALLTDIGGLDYNGTINLSSDNAIAPLLELILNQSTSVSIDTQVFNQSIADLNAIVSLASDSNLTILGTLDFFNSITLTSNQILNADLTLILESSVSLATVNQFSALLSLVLDGNVFVSSDHSISITNFISFDAITSITSSHQVSTVLEQILNTIISLNSDSIVQQIGISDLSALISLSSNNTLVSAVTLDINQTVSLISDNQLVTTNISDLIALASVSSTADLITINGLIAEVISVLSSDSVVGATPVTTLNGSVVIQSNNAFDTAIILEAAMEVSLTMLSDTQIIPIANINGIASVLLQSDNILNNAHTVDLLAQLSLQTDSSITDNNLTSFLSNIALLTNNNIEVSYDQFSAIVVDLISISQMSINESVSKLSQMQLQLNNSVVFDIVMEIYNQISILSNAGIVTVAEILTIIDKEFHLGVSIDDIYQCAQIFNSDYIDLKVNTIIDFIANINWIDNSENEIIELKSLITNNLKFRSFICDILLKNSEIILNEINAKSLITNYIIENSIVTNKLNLTSKIK